MKKWFLPFFVVAPLALTSCIKLFDTYEKEINVYDIDAIDSTNQLSSGYQTTLKAQFIEGNDYIPYVTFKQYASLYEKHFASDVTSEISEEYYATTWYVKKGKEYHFAAIIDRSSKRIMIAGNLDGVYAENDDPRDLEALNYGLKVDSSESKILNGDGYGTYNYSRYSITTFRNNYETYYPLSLLDITFCDTTSIYFNYNYKHILSTRDVDNYSAKKYLDEGVEYTFDTQMKANALDHTIPSYLVNFNTEIFLYMMDNLYGLKDLKGYYSYETYLRNRGIYSYLNSSNGDTRGQGYADALSVLDDGHTALISINQSWGENYVIRRRYGEEVAKRSEVGNNLFKYRKETYASYRENGQVVNKTPGKDVLYSADGKTALFSFDTFEFGKSSEVFDAKGEIASTAKDHDTYFKLIDVFNEIKAKGGVENVVLDISVNGGGVVGVMIKLLALISKNNSSNICLYQDKTTQLGVYNGKIDLNNDKEYNADECYGNDFNFYILTSPYSYSCANAFPCSAQVNGSAKIIGQKSGGGECAVAIHYLPNSEYVYHSSNLHLGSYDAVNNKFNGFECGATPDISLPIDENFFSIENLNSAIQNAESNL